MNPGTAIITGAAGGIGRAIARKLAAQGCRLTLVDLQEAPLQALSDEISGEYGTECLCLAADLSGEAFLLHIAEATDTRYGRIDILVNNAAWRTLDSLRHIERDSWQRTLDVCLTAPAFLGRHVAAVMERRMTGGVIVNISSMMSDRPAGNSPAYIAAKAGLEGLTREMAVTYGRSGIRVVCIRPGFIDTGLTSSSFLGGVVTKEGRSSSSSRKVLALGTPEFSPSFLGVS